MKITRDGVAVKSSKQTNNTNPRSEAMELITSAIHSLGVNAKDDIVAKESIANLSVVLMDLQKS